MLAVFIGIGEYRAGETEHTTVYCAAMCVARNTSKATVGEMLRRCYDDVTIML